MQGKMHMDFLFLFSMPPTSKKLRGHISSGLSIHLSICHACHIFGTMPNRVLKLHIWIHHQKLVISIFFFLSTLSPFLELSSFGENHNESLSARYHLNI